MPLETPLNVWIRCVWQLSGVKQWWRMIDQDSPDAGIVPSSVSVAFQAKLIRSPTRQVSVDDGAVIIGTGGVFPPPTVIVIGLLMFVAPWLSVTCRRTL